MIGGLSHDEYINKRCGRFDAYDFTINHVNFLYQDAVELTFTNNILFIEFDFGKITYESVINPIPL